MSLRKKTKGNSFSNEHSHVNSYELAYHYIDTQSVSHNAQVITPNSRIHVIQAIPIMQKLFDMIYTRVRCEKHLTIKRVGVATLINTFKKDPLSGSLDDARVKWPYAHMKENQKKGCKC